MSNDVNIALATRARTCEHFRWMPGMRSVQRGIVVRADGHDVTWLDELGACLADGGELDDEPIPDLSDPATLGCLLELVREAWVWATGYRILIDITELHEDEDFEVLIEVMGAERVGYSDIFGYFKAATRAAALVAALEGAP